jgi:hypothetical protein
VCVCLGHKQAVKDEGARVADGSWDFRVKAYS